MRLDVLSGLCLIHSSLQSFYVTFLHHLIVLKYVFDLKLVNAIEVRWFTLQSCILMVGGIYGFHMQFI